MANRRIVNDTSVTADTNHPAIEFPRNHDNPIYFDIQAIWGVISGTKDSTIKLETSMDGTNYDLLGTEITMDADNDSHTFRVQWRGDAFIRSVYTEKNATNITTLVIRTSLPATLVTEV